MQTTESGSRFHDATRRRTLPTTPSRASVACGVRSQQNWAKTGLGKDNLVVTSEHLAATWAATGMNLSND